MVFLGLAEGAFIEAEFLLRLIFAWGLLRLEAKESSEVMVGMCDEHTKLGDRNLRVRRVALWQCAPSLQGNKRQAVAVIEKMCGLAKENSADIIVFPEMFLTGYAIGPDMARTQAEPYDGETAQTVKKFAQNHQ